LINTAYRFAQGRIFPAIISTQGDGEPPGAVRNFIPYSPERRQTRQTEIQSYWRLATPPIPCFAKPKEDVDAQLQKLGGKSQAPIQKCDTDYDEDANAWFASVLQSLTATIQPALPQRCHCKRKAVVKKRIPGPAHQCKPE